MWFECGECMPVMVSMCAKLLISIMHLSSENHEYSVYETVNVVLQKQISDKWITILHKSFKILKKNLIWAFGKKVWSQMYKGIWIPMNHRHTCFSCKMIYCNIPNTTKNPGFATWLRRQFYQYDWCFSKHVCWWKAEEIFIKQFLFIELVLGFKPFLAFKLKLSLKLLACKLWSVREIQYM